MSDAIKHECGIAMIRLRKPLQHFIDKYGTPAFGANKLYLLMEKQHNRGQDGAGVANIKLHMPPGHQYIYRQRSIDNQPLLHIFNHVYKGYRALDAKSAQYHDADWLKENVDWTGELWLGHLRYGTHGLNSIENCHPMMRLNNWRSRNLIVAGNFNMTNVDDLFNKLVELGQHPKEKVDTITVMEKIGHFLDEEIQRQFEYYKDQYNNVEISEIIESKLDLQRVLQRSCRDFDGGYAMAGLIGHGAAFVARDPNGIRPAYFYANDEVVVVASEKPAIKTAFGCEFDAIEEIKPGHALIIDKDGNYSQKEFITPGQRLSCSFERIYFSRGSDPDIYKERKRLGALLAPQVLEAIDHDLANTVFSYIPNTAETAFLGLTAALEEQSLAQYVPGQPLVRPRVEKLVIKDAKLRTFITNDADREDLVSHVYDTTYEVINKHTDTLVVIDDSIVRGTTLEKSILTMLDRLQPRRVVVVSSAPQIRYPDCYGIDMSRMGDFVAFRALISLLDQRDWHYKLDECYQQCLTAREAGTLGQTNYVQSLYALFTDDEISQEVARIVKPRHMTAEVQVIFQTVENLHVACPRHLGDWYFTGNYPTAGGNCVVNKAFINYMEGKKVRAY